MDKLIELLDQYRKQNPREFFGDDGSLVVLTWKDFIELNRLIIISKEYEFIKWLVDNDKIDYKKDWKNSNDTWYIYVKADTEKSDLEIKSDTLLMVLAIEDNPIEFLCSVLK